jgi:pyruvate/2-oxoglutarate dehydrogenase complex dihydrolipoamide acyltransferase (E2) component
MITRVSVPHLDANIIDVTVTAWRKAPGDHVQPGEIVAELTTDKATFELESPGSGTLLKILAAPKSVVPSGYILAVLGEAGEADPGAQSHNDRLMDRHRAEAGGQRSEVGGERSEAGGQPPAANHAHQPPAAPTARIRATPRARRLAQEQGLDLARVQAETGAEVVDESVLQKYLEK